MFKLFLIYIILNAFLFLPRYLINIKSTRFIPVTFKDVSVRTMIAGLYRRNNNDVFRLSFDFALLSLLASYANPWPGPGWWNVIFYLYIFFFFVYNFYYHAIKKMYVTEPVLYSDMGMVILGIRVLYNGYKKYFFIALLFLVVLVLGLYQLTSVYVRELTEYSAIHPWMTKIWGLVILGGIVTFVHTRMVWVLYTRTIISHFYLLLFNIRESIKTYRRIQKLKGIPAYSAALQHENIAFKPNIYFLLVESYGAVLSSHPVFSNRYQSLCQTIESRLFHHGISSVSNFTVSPRSGGGSWMVYTSLFYGIKTDSIGLFRAIHGKKFQERHKSLLHILQDAGYTNYYLAPLGGFDSFSLDWEEIKRTFAVSEFLRFKDFKYSGPLISGFGKQIPDQYVINAAQDHFEKRGASPMTCFYLTQNSHAHWITPISVEDDFRSINDPAYLLNLTTPAMKYMEDNYFRAIDYQLSFISDFIIKRLGDNDLVIIIGDHQPIALVGDNDSYATPVHIVSRHSSFLDHFEEYGFTKGMSPKANNDIRHEAIYSMLLRTLMKESKGSSNLLPEYLRNGLIYD